MVDISLKRFEEIVRGFAAKRIAVIGDLMIDRYLWGTVRRISPEAPVPIVDIESETIALGGAGNVANNLHYLKVVPVMMGVVGSDTIGKVLVDILKNNGMPTAGIMEDPTRQTSEKTRIIAHDQHVVRADRETRYDIDEEIQQKLLHHLESVIDTLDGIILQDYNKGVLTTRVIHGCINIANQHGKIIAVDPKLDNFFEYQDITLFKPNTREIEQAMGVVLNNDEAVIQIGAELCERIKCRHLLITRGEKGMILFDGAHQWFNVPTRARKVHDVSGAGDTVISTMAAAIVGGAEIKEAASLANLAAGIVCEEVGITPITLDKLRKGLTRTD
jgi:rfaE bifunctional protein kinase chain/domain